MTKNVDYMEIRDEAISGISEIANDLDKAYGAVSIYLSAYNQASEVVADLEREIESKKNNMIASGMIVGKNAEERAANTWVAIPEYDDLEVAKIEQARARVQLDIAQNDLSRKRRRYAHKTFMMSQASRALELMLYDDSCADDFADELDDGEFIAGD